MRGFCVVTAQLNAHLAREERAEARAEAVDEKLDELVEQALTGKPEIDGELLLEAFQYDDETEAAFLQKLVACFAATENAERLAKLAELRDWFAGELRKVPRLETEADDSVSDQEDDYRAGLHLEPEDYDA